MSTEFFLSGSDRYLRDPNMRLAEMTSWKRGVGGRPEAATDDGSLLGVVLHDELLLDRHVDLRADRDLVDQDAHPRRDDLHPRGGDALAVGLASNDQRRELEGLLAHVDDVGVGDLEGRDVDLLAVDEEVAVHDELAGLAARTGEAGAVDHVVEAALEELQEVVAGLALATAGLLVVADELLLHHAGGETSLLLLTELQQVLGLLDATAAVLAGGVGTLLEGCVAADEVDTETARLAGHGTGVAGHVSVSLSQSRVRRDGAWAAGIRCGGWA